MYERPTLTPQLDAFILLGIFLAVLLTSAIFGLGAAKLFEWFTRKDPPNQLE